jgi:hypothetical protein
MMLTTRGGRLSEAWWAQGIVIAAVLLTLGTGFCLFDAHDDGGDGHVVPPDLCLGMLAVSLVVMPLARLFATGSVVIPFPSEAHSVARQIPVPPPRPFCSAS